jgi:poly(A) RNA polymerase GLD2
LNNEELPKSLSPTPTPSNSSKSESPTIENPQNIKKDADQIQITFGDFENLDDEVSSNASSQNNHPIGIKVESEELTMSTSGSSTTSTGNHQEIESYPRTALNNQLTTTQHQDYLGDHHTVWLGGFHPATFPPSPSIEFIQTFPTIHHYQHQQQSYEEPTTQSTSKRRINGRVSPNAGVYQNPVPIQYSATFPPNYVRSNSGNYRSYINYNLAYPSPADRFLARSYMVEIKEPPKQLLNNSKWDRLSQAIWNKFQKRQQTEETYKRKMQLWKQLYLIMKDKFLEKSHPNNGLYLVGSTISGFGADSSDMDMCLVARNCLGADQRSESLNKLGEIRNFIMNSSNIFKEFTLIQARVPILRFKDSHNSLEVDLNVNNCVGVRNTHLLYCYSQSEYSFFS